jgi:hypothetical protein
MNLDDLFTITDYKKVGVDIPHFDADTSEDDPEENLHIDIFCSTAASTDFDLTGQILWPVSVLLSHYLASKQGRAILKGRNIVELGAGCGLAGLAAAPFCDQVVITDGEEVIMDLLKKNEDYRENVTALPFTWGMRKDLNDILATMENASVDVVVAADVVQWPTVIEPLLHSVKALLWNSRSDKPSLVLGIVNRAHNVYELFFEKAKDLGFTWKKIPNESFLRDGVVPTSCQECGGRETQVFIVELLDRSETPTMLEDGDDSTWTKF